MTSGRASIVDLFENFLLDDIAKIDPKKLSKLADKEQDELAERIDEFLLGACEDRFAEDSVVMDGFSSPIIVPDDVTLPRTTRRAKQVALSHTEVIFPLEEYGLAHRELGEARLVAFCSWVKVNAPLLRAHVFSLAAAPSPLDVLTPEAMMQIIDEGLEKEGIDALEAALNSLGIATQIGIEQRPQEISALIAATLQDGAAAGSFGADLSFTHTPSGAMYRSLVDRMGGHQRHGLIGHAALLNDLELPAIDNLPDEDFVLIRDEAEDFDMFRTALSRSLNLTEEKMEAGIELFDAFNSSLDEVRWRAELLRERTKDGDMGRYLRNQSQGVAMGTVMTTAAAAAAGPLGLAGLSAIAAQAGAALVAGAMFALLTYRTPKRERRLIRFYDVLLGDA